MITLNINKRSFNMKSEICINFICNDLIQDSDYKRRNWRIRIVKVSSKLACALIQDTDQPVHLRSLIRVIDMRSMRSQGSNVPPGAKLRSYKVVRLRRLI